MALEFSLFGKFSARREGQALAGLEAPKVQQILSYLLLYPDRPHPREALAHVLRDNDHTDQPAKRLRKTLWQLRNALAPLPNSPEAPLLWADSEYIQINPQAELSLDTRQFEQAWLKVRGVPGRALDAEDALALRRALELYRGGLQESWYQDWYLYERERFRHSYLVLLDKLMGYCEAQHHYEEGLAYGTLILRSDPASERTHRRLMRLYYLAGDRTAALRQYQRCVDALAQELNVEPAQSTVALYQHIRADRLAAKVSLPSTPAHPAPIPPAPMPAHVARPATTDPLPLSAVLERLIHLEQTLLELRQEVHQDIQTVRLSINEC